MKTLSAMSLALTLALPVAAQQAEPAPAPRPQRPGPMAGPMGRMGHGPAMAQQRMAKALNLTEAQKASLKGIREKFQPLVAQQRDLHRKAQQALREALRAEKTSEGEIKALYDKAAALRFDLLMAQRKLRAEMAAVLTPEQRTKAVAIRAFMAGEAQGRAEAQGRGRGPMGPGMPGPGMGQEPRRQD